MKGRKGVGADPEIGAMSLISDALHGLPVDSQARVLEYFWGKLKIGRPIGSQADLSSSREGEDLRGGPPGEKTQEPGTLHDELTGVSPVAKKWIARSSLSADALGKIFSLGGDEIDLIAKKVPGGNKKERMHNVFLLKGIAAYLASGAARFAHDQVKEACLHYDAYDAANFASYLKSFSAEVSGDKGTGYTLTPRGLADGTDLVRQMGAANSKA